MLVRIHSSQHPLAPALTYEQASFWWTRVICVFENWTAIVDHIIKASGSYKSIIKCRFSTMRPCSTALLIPLSEACLNGQLLCLSSRLFLCCQHYDQLYTRTDGHPLWSLLMFSSCVSGCAFDRRAGHCQNRHHQRLLV